MNIADAIMNLRYKSGMSMKQVADEIDMAKATISNVETGHRGGTFKTVEKILSVFGYELKIVKKGTFKADILEWSKELPEEMYPDDEANEYLIAEFGRPLKSKDEFLVLTEQGNIISSRLYLFEDGKIEVDRYWNEKPVAWMAKPEV